jgi:hypothetical protein
LAARRAHHRQVAGMQRSHGRDKSEAAVIPASRLAGGAHLGDRTADLHDAILTTATRRQDIFTAENAEDAEKNEQGTGKKWIEFLCGLGGVCGEIYFK